MTQDEFKARFEGFTENIPGLPDKRQWERVKKRVKEIDETSIHPGTLERINKRYPALPHEWWTIRGNERSSVHRQAGRDEVHDLV